VTAADHYSGNSNQIILTNEKGRLSWKQIEEMIATAEQYKAEDELERKRIEAKNWEDSTDPLKTYEYEAKSTGLEHILSPIVPTM
jgi:molecular chaperone DnaK (HSP70)